MNKNAGLRYFSSGFTFQSQELRLSFTPSIVSTDAWEAAELVIHWLRSDREPLQNSPSLLWPHFLSIPRPKKKKVLFFYYQIFINKSFHTSCTFFRLKFLPNVFPLTITRNLNITEYNTKHLILQLRLYCLHISSYSQDDVVLHLQELIWRITTEDEIELPDTRILFHCLSFISHVAGTKVASPFSLGLPRTFMALRSIATDVHTAHCFPPEQHIHEKWKPGCLCVVTDLI